MAAPPPPGVRRKVQLECRRCIEGANASSLTLALKLMWCKELLCEVRLGGITYQFHSSDCDLANFPTVHWMRKLMKGVRMLISTASLSLRLLESFLMADDDLWEGEQF